MSVFTPAEIAYLESQRLGRLATINAAGDPHLVPVGFRYNPELDTIDIGGYRNSATKKFRDVARDGRVAFLVDDVLPRGSRVSSRSVAARRRCKRGARR